MTDMAGRALIGNEMHSPTSASPLPTATSIFLIGNEFQLRRARQKSPTLTKRAWGTRQSKFLVVPIKCIGTHSPRQAGLTPFAKEIGRASCRERV